MLLVIGSLAIAALDGLTRAQNVDWEYFSSEALVYEPNLAAYILAAFSLPLFWNFAQHRMIGSLEAVLLWFVFCTVCYTKDFAYIHLPGTPLFITEIVLAVAIFGRFVWPSLRLPRLYPKASILVAVFFFEGVFQVFRGISTGNETIFVLRDFALAMYPLFLLIGLYAFQDWTAVRRFCVCFVAAAAVASVIGLLWFLSVPQQRRYIFYPPAVLSSLIAVLLCTSAGLVRRWVGWSLVLLLGVGLVLANARTLYVVFAAVMGIAFFTVNMVTEKIKIARLKLLAAFSAVALIVLLILLSTGAGSRFLQQTRVELVSGTLNFQEDANAGFRFLAWAEALRRFSENPLIGEGFGVPFTFVSETTDVRPHNSFLTVLYKTGLLGFVPVMLLVLHLYLSGWRSIRQRRQAGSFLLYAFLLGHLSMSVYGLLNLVLESPFLASIYWLTAGVTYRLMRISDSMPNMVGTAVTQP
ncbi:MAG: O-antigen ligase family protein [Candidatus Korobacteraceae bacterium]